MIIRYIFNFLFAVGVNVFSSANPISVTLEGSGSSFRFVIEVRQDSQYSGNLQFQLSLRNTEDGAVVFIQQNAIVTITDIDGENCYINCSTSFFQIH